MPRVLSREELARRKARHGDGSLVVVPMPTAPPSPPALPSVPDNGHDDLRQVVSELSAAVIESGRMQAKAVQSALAVAMAKQDVPKAIKPEVWEFDFHRDRYGNLQRITAREQ